MRCLKSLDTAVVRTIPSALEKCALVSVVPKKKPVLQFVHLFSSPYNLSMTFRNIPFSATANLYDVTKVPDFGSYRSLSKRDPAKSVKSDHPRRVFVYAQTVAALALGTVAAKGIFKTIIGPIGPGARHLAASISEVNLSTIPEGKNITITWRNKPLFIRHRSQEEIDRERAVPLSELRDPQKDEDRVKNDGKWLICLGVCTHLGCIPIPHAGEYIGGYYCPCHGSHYDASGRIRKGPAPTNLEVPEYNFIDENTVVVG